MPAFKDLTGQVFNRLTVLRAVGRNKCGNVVWLCRCSCDGKEVAIAGNHLANSHSHSCGCFSREVAAVRAAGQCGPKSGMFKHGHGTGYQQSRTYSSWANMIQRCTNSRATRFERYGGAGITVCDRWLNSFEAFLEDMGERPEGTTLGRFGDVGNYEPVNCAWQTDAEQKAEYKLKYTAEERSAMASIRLRAGWVTRRKRQLVAA